MAARRGSAEWKGDLKGGGGTLSVGDGVFEGDYSFSSRFEEGEGTNPEELIGAALASCYAMALGNILAEADTPADSVRTTANVQLRVLDEAPTIAQIDLEVVGSVPGIEDDDFVRRAEEAKRDCPVSRALAAVPEINLQARLA